MDIVRNWLDDQSIMGLIPAGIYNKRIMELNSSSGHENPWALQTINRADIQCMDLIRMEAQIIAFVPEGESEVLMQTQASHVFPLKKTDLPDDQIKSSKNVFILNHETWLDAGQLRSDYIYKYDQFPLGDAVSSEAMKVTDWDGHESVRIGVETSIYDPEYGSIKTCYYEALNKRIRLPEPASSGGDYLTWNARIRPANVDVTNLQSYRIRTPAHYRSMLEHFVKKELTPEGTESRKLLDRNEPNIIAMAQNSIDPPARTISMPWEI